MLFTNLDGNLNVNLSTNISSNNNEAPPSTSVYWMDVDGKIWEDIDLMLWAESIGS
jgi:hypothetical protein